MSSHDSTAVPDVQAATARRRSPLTGGVVVALLGVYLIWGSTYLAIRVVVTNGIPPLLGMGVRFVVAGLLLAGLLRLRAGPGALRVTRAELRTAAVVGSLLLAGGNGLVAVSEQQLPSGLAALLVSTTPLWIVVLGSFAGERPRRWPVVGTLVGFAGTAVLARPGALGAVAWGWALLVLVATASWATGSLYSRRRPRPRDLFVSSAYQMLLGGAVLTLCGLARGEAGSVRLEAVTPSGWWALAYLVTIGSLAGYTAYFYLLANAPLQLATTYAYVNPVVAVLLGWLLLGELVTGGELAGGALAIAGVAIVISTDRGH
jgi:drug/metabolite transporter (DMT)-like permease